MPSSRRQNPDFDDYRSPPKKNSAQRGALSTISSQIGDRDPSTYEKPGRSN